MIALERLAVALQVAIVETPRLRDDKNAVYVHHRRIILMRPDLDHYTRRVALAHELGHAYYGDEQPDDPRLERRADQFAARVLITPDEYAHAEVLHGPHDGAIAWELGVTPELIVTWRDLYERNLTP